MTGRCRARLGQGPQSTGSSEVSASESEQGFAEARAVWRAALRSHALAPPDAGFSTRIASLAEAARGRAEACEAADRDGFGGRRPEAAPARPTSCGLERGAGAPRTSGRASTSPSLSSIASAEGRSLRAVARAYADLADVASELAVAVEREDRASGLLPAVARAGRRRASAKR